MQIGIGIFLVERGKIKILTSDFTIYTILGFATGGIWFLVWDYYIHTAPDNMYQIFHKAEDIMIEVVTSCCKRD